MCIRDRDDNGDQADDASVFAVEKAEDGVIARGNCGYDGYGSDDSNLTWKLTGDGTLTISDVYKRQGGRPQTQYLYGQTVRQGF